VQSVAVKCLSILLKKVHPAQMHEIGEKLGSLLLDGNGQLTDIYSIGLKTMISDAPDELGQLVADDLCPRLLNGISRASSEDVKRECLDIMSDLLRRFGHLFEKDHNDIMQALIRLLKIERVTLRKRASVCLSALAVVATDHLLNRIVDTILTHITEAEQSRGITSSETQSLMQTLCSIARAVGHRLGRDLPRLVPLFLRFCGDCNECLEEENETKLAAMNEMQEYCFSGLESFVERCPREVGPFLNDILLKASSFIKFDPNYTYDDEEENAMDADEEAEGSEEMDDAMEDDEGEYAGSDDDDNSWKVRKNAVKVMTAVIVSSSHDVLVTVVNSYSTLLLSRLKEREENVRLDVISCWQSLLLALQAHRAGPSDASLGSEGITDDSAIFQRLLNYIPGLMKQYKKHFDGQSIKTKSALFSLLKTFVEVTRLDLSSYLPILVSSVESSLKDKNQALRLDALVFLRSLLQTQDAAQMRPYISNLLNPLVIAINGDWYKIIAEAVRVAGVIVCVWRPSSPAGSTSSSASDNTMITAIYSAILPKLEALDIDQEIKECAIIVCGKLFAHAGDVLADRLPHILTLLHKRLENEILRIATLRTIAVMASSSLQLDLSGHINGFLTDIGAFLRQQNRNLKVTSLNTLSALLLSSCAESAVQNQAVEGLFREVATVIDDSDLHLTTVAVKLCTDTYIQRPVFRQIVIDNVYSTLLHVSGSSSLHGQTLEAVVVCLQTIVQNDCESTLLASTVSELKSRTQQRDASLHKQAVFNIARCIVGVCGASDDASGVKSINDEFLHDLRSFRDDRSVHLALLVVGDLGASSESPQQMRELILRCVEQGSEDVKNAAAYCLGHLAVRNITTYLPIILEDVLDNSTVTAATSSRHQYFLLSALKELIVSASSHAHSGTPRSTAVSALTSHLDTILPHLFSKFAVEDEGVRGLVSECVGSIAAFHSEQIVPVLLSTASEASTRYESYVAAATVEPADAENNSSKQAGSCLSLWTVISAVRFAVSRARIPRGHSSEEDLRTAALALVKYVQFPDLEVRKSAFLLVNACLHHNPRIASHFVSEIIPSLFEAFTFKSERIVDLGPFKHRVRILFSFLVISSLYLAGAQVDDGLPLRKLSLTCLESVLNTKPGTFVFSPVLGLFTSKYVPLLGDKDEVKVQAHQV
jgi:cullin-associated NEDD8-dissociated protein 1